MHREGRFSLFPPFPVAFQLVSEWDRGNIYLRSEQSFLFPSPDHHFYEESKPFTCLDGTATIPFDQVNDDYCDCKDGSDEPGERLHLPIAH